MRRKDSLDLLSRGRYSKWRISASNSPSSEIFALLMDSYIIGTAVSLENSNMIKCPYCLDNINPKLEQKKNAAPYICPECGVEIPRDYVEKRNISRTTVGLVGFPGHGKTVYITSLFYLLKYLRSQWKDYFLLSLDDNTHQVVHHHVPLFENSRLPEATPSNFPTPSLIYFRNIPLFGDRFLCLYDTSGEIFEDTRRIPEQGRFVAHSDCVLFNISINDCGREWSDRMIELLDIYIRAVHGRMHADIKNYQHLIVVLTKADSLITENSAKVLPGNLLGDMIHSGSYKNYINHYEDMDIIGRLKRRSEILRSWLFREGDQGFINMARDYFKSVEYTLVSSTGAAPVGRRLATRLTPHDPKMVLDPFLWVLEKNRPRSIWERFSERWNVMRDA
ncbi:hypothetical protein QUF80_15880 [Desulfococcaceae bacterium HSG8]|nr:hypothetical protein [Desulfococcaceae bacterium HSG8]